MDRYMNMNENELANNGFKACGADDYFGDGDIYNVYESAWGVVLCENGKVVWVKD